MKGECGNRIVKNQRKFNTINKAVMFGVLVSWLLCIVCSKQSWFVNDVYCFSAKGERGGSEGEEDLEEITDSAEESDENDEQAPPPATTAQVTTPTPAVRHTGRPGVLLLPCLLKTSSFGEREKRKCNGALMESGFCPALAKCEND